MLEEQLENFHISFQDSITLKQMINCVQSSVIDRIRIVLLDIQKELNERQVSALDSEMKGVATLVIDVRTGRRNSLVN